MPEPQTPQDAIVWYSPTLFVGLGGTGCRIVDQIARLSRPLVRHLAGDSTVDRILPSPYQFLCIDTDGGTLDSLRFVPKPARISLGSSEDRRRQQIEQLAGMMARGGSPAPDEYFERILPKWYLAEMRAMRRPRATTTGAGQVRVESRIDLYLHLADAGSGAKLLQALGRIGKQMRAAPYTRPGAQSVNVFVFTSLAGGTGAGLFLAVPYIVDAMLGRSDFKNGTRRHLVAVLPQLLAVTDPKATRQMKRNAYVALCELEHLQRLRCSFHETAKEAVALIEAFGVPPSARAGKVPFVVLPPRCEPSITEVDTKPYDLIFLAARLPAGVPDDDKLGFIADFGWAMSRGEATESLISIQNAQAINYGDMASSLYGLHTQTYGTFATAIVLVPDEDIAKYCQYRYAAELLDSIAQGELVAVADEELEEAQNQPAVRKGLPEEDYLFARRLERAAQLARQEREARGDKEPTEQELLVDLRYRDNRTLVDEILARAERAVEALQVPAPDTVAHRAERVLQDRDVEKMRVDRVREELDAIIEHFERELISARKTRLTNARDSARQLIRDIDILVDTENVHGLRRRYFFAKLFEAFVERIAGTDQKSAPGAQNRAAISHKFAASLRNTAPFTVYERVFRKRNADFLETRSRFISEATDYLRSRAKGFTSELHAQFLAEVTEALRTRLLSRRAVRVAAEGLGEQLVGRAEEARADGVGPDDSHETNGPGVSNVVPTAVEVPRALVEEGGRSSPLWDRVYARLFDSHWRASVEDDARAVSARAEDDALEATRKGPLTPDDRTALRERVRAVALEVAWSRVAPFTVGQKRVRTVAPSSRKAAGFLIDDALEVELEWARQKEGRPLVPNVDTWFREKTLEKRAGDILSATLLYREDAGHTPVRSAFIHCAGFPFYGPASPVGRVIEDLNGTVCDWAGHSGASAPPTVTVNPAPGGGGRVVYPDPKTIPITSTVYGLTLSEITDVCDALEGDWLENRADRYAPVGALVDECSDAAFEGILPLSMRVAQAIDRARRMNNPRDWIWAVALLVWKEWLSPRHDPGRDPQLDLSYSGVTVSVDSLALVKSNGLDELEEKSGVRKEVERALEEAKAEVIGGDSEVVRRFLEGFDDFLGQWRAYLVHALDVVGAQIDAFAPADPPDSLLDRRQTLREENALVGRVRDEMRRSFSELYLRI